MRTIQNSTEQNSRISIPINKFRGAGIGRFFSHASRLEKKTFIFSTNKYVRMKPELMNSTAVYFLIFNFARLNFEF